MSHKEQELLVPAVIIKPQSEGNRLPSFYLLPKLFSLFVREFRKMPTISELFTFGSDIVLNRRLAPRLTASPLLRYLYFVAFLAYILLTLPALLLHEIVVSAPYHGCPGSSLRRFARNAFSPASYILVLEPTLSDLAEEHALAVAENRPWRARGVRLRGYWAFWRAAGGLAACRLLRLPRSQHNWD